MAAGETSGGPPPLPKRLLVGVTAWRLLIAASAFIGVAAAAGHMVDPWRGLSQLASVFAGLTYLWLAAFPLATRGRRLEPRSPWLRGATTVLMVLVAITYLSVMEGRIDQTWSLFEHLITPLLVLADWLLVGRNQAAVRWWHPLSWVSLPLLYTVYVNLAGHRVYRGMLEAGDRDFPAVAAGFLAAIIALGYLVYGAGRLRRRHRT